MLNVFVIVWRECLEAMLLLGILAAWVGRSRPGAMRALWGGVGGGVLLACLLAALMQGTLAGLSDTGQETFQAALLFIAAALMTHMVFWMSRHARHLKRNLETALDQAAERRGAIGIALVAAVAVAREGAETVIFLQGVAGGSGSGSLLLAAAAGFGVAALTAWAAARGLRFLPPQQVFRISAALLLLFAGGMVAAGTDRLIGLEVLPPGADPLWDTSPWLDDASGAGKWLADLLGYRARPALTVVAAYLGFWAALLAASRLHRNAPPSTAATR